MHKQNVNKLFEVWHVDNSYKYYYQKGSEILGTNEPFAPMEPG